MDRGNYSGTQLMPPAAASKKGGSERGPFTLSPRQRSPAPPAGGLRPPAPPAEEFAFIIFEEDKL